MLRIDADERLAYWQEREVIAGERVRFWLKVGDKMAPGAMKRARDWHKMTIELVEGWQTVVKERLKAAA